MGTNHSIEKPTIFFDGVCNLCNASILFVIKRDKNQFFQFSSLQSAHAQESLPIELTADDSYNSIALKSGDEIVTKSTAALEIARRLSGGWPLLYAFIIVPKFLRDWGYSIVADNRYRWFGKKDQCMIPSPDLQSRFID